MRNVEYVYKKYVSKGRQGRIVSLARGTKDDDNDQNDHIYAVYSIAVM